MCIDPSSIVLMFAPDLNAEGIHPFMNRMAMNLLAKALATLLPSFLFFRLRNTMNSH